MDEIDYESGGHNFKICLAISKNNKSCVWPRIPREKAIYDFSLSNIYCVKIKKRSTLELIKSLSSVLFGVTFSVTNWLILT